MIILKKSLIEIKNELSLKSIFIDIFFFGSILYCTKNTDIDILILYEDDYSLIQIKDKIHTLSLKYPLDIYYMTPTEVEELQFIRKVKAINIINLNVLQNR